MAVGERDGINVQRSSQLAMEAMDDDEQSFSEVVLVFYIGFVFLTLYPLKNNKIF